MDYYSHFCKDYSLKREFMFEHGQYLNVNTSHGKGA